MASHAGRSFIRCVEGLSLEVKYIVFAIQAGFGLVDEAESETGSQRACLLPIQ